MIFISRVEEGMTDNKNISGNTTIYLSQMLSSVVIFVILSEVMSGHTLSENPLLPAISYLLPCTERRYFTERTETPHSV